MRKQSTSKSVSDYTVGGKLTTNGDPFARTVRDEGRSRFYVAYATDGIESGRMRNHLSGHQDNPMVNRSVQRTGKSMYELREVSQESFECYMDFLTRGDEKALRNAERFAR